MELTRAEFSEQVRHALANIYDPVALRALASAHPNGHAAGLAPARGDEEALRERLLAAIETLQPGPLVDPTVKAWRSYRLLWWRYVEALDPTAVQRRLAIGRSQYYREHEAALTSLVNVLAAESWSAGDAPGGRTEQAPAALPVSRFSTRRSLRWVVVGALGCLGAVVLVTALIVGNRASGASVASASLSIYAGNGQPGHVNGAAVAAQFAGPFGLSIDPGGTLYVADTGNHRVRSITTSGLVLDLAGSGAEGYADGPSASAQFSSPNAVTVGPDSTVYVGDSGNLRIRAISPAGTVSTLAGSGVAGYVDGVGAEAQFAATGAIVADRAGSLYVPDRFNNVIRQITPGGVVSTLAGSGVRGHADGPADAAQFNVPMRMGGVDGAGSVYVLDTGDNRIRRITPERIVSTVAGSNDPGYADGPAARAQFSSDIQGLTVDASGNLYVMDAGNRRVRGVSRDGLVSTIFEFTNPEQTPGNVKVNAAGNTLYVSDRQHNVIYKLSLQMGR